MDVAVRLGRKETLYDFTERAINATLQGTLIPPLVYVPANLRARGAVRVSLDDVATIVPPTDTENIQRIHKADPVGFLIAVMQGQPIPRIIISQEERKITARTVFEEPPLPCRIRAAEFLGKFKGKLKPGEAGYEAMIANAAARADEEDDDVKSND